MILEGNPVYDAPADLNFAAAPAQGSVFSTFEFIRRRNVRACQWHVPVTHLLESWSDTRGSTAPPASCSRSLHRCSTAEQLTNFWPRSTGQPQTSAYEIVRDYWRQQHRDASNAADGNFDDWWKTALHDGVVADTASPSQYANTSCGFCGRTWRPIQPSVVAAQSGTQPILCFRPDPSVWDGRFANNGWLQELPRPLTKLTWDNAALVSPHLADEHELRTGDVVEITRDDATIRIPVFVVPGQPANTITLPLGYGRQRAGRIGNGVGVDVYPLRTSDAMWVAEATALRKTGETYNSRRRSIITSWKARPIVRTGTLAELLARLRTIPAFMHTGHSADAETFDVSRVEVRRLQVGHESSTNRRASAAMRASWHARRRTTFRSSARIRWLAAAKCTGCASITIAKGPSTRRRTTISR